MTLRKRSFKEENQDYESKEEILTQNSQTFDQAATNEIETIKSDKDIVRSDSEESSSEIPTKNDFQSNIKINRPRLVLDQDLNKYKKGSLIKISMKRFVAYDYCEIKPGTNLNMIIGPNGTGKSTIVCAIALGLGGTPALLGRTKEISGFVKHGFDSGYVQITLKGPGKNETTTIQRTINSKNNNSTYKLNGIHSSAAKVGQVVKKLNIQLDNLCQFLPQDRVVEFAKLDGQQLLKETQRAVGQTDLLDMQLELVELKSQETKYFLELEDENDSIRHLEQRNEQLQRDVERWEECARAEKMVKILEVQLPLRKLEEARISYTESKEIRKVKAKEHKDLTQGLLPLKNELDRIRDTENETKEGRRKIEGYVRSIKEKIRRNGDSISSLENQTTEKRKEIEEIDKRFEKIEQERRDLDKEISQIETSLQNKPDDNKVREANGHIKELLDSEQKVRMQIRETQEKVESIKNEGRDAQNSLSRLNQRLRTLEDVKARRVTVLKKFNNDTAVGLEWLEGHRTEFQEHVFGPVALEIKLKRGDCANILETVIGSSTLKTFVCQNEADYRTITKELNDKLRLRTNSSMLNHLSISNFKPPVSKQELLRWGFDCYAIDLIEAPPPVLITLCNNDGIHRIPVSFSKEVDHGAIEASGLVKAYVANGVRYQITTSRYGNKTSSTTATGIKPLSKVALLGIGDSVEMQQERVAISEQIDQLRKQLELNEGKIRKLVTEEQKLIKIIESDIQPKAMHHRKLKDNALREIQNWERLNVKLESKKSRLASLLSAITNKDNKQQNEVKRIQESVGSLALERLKILEKSQKLIGELQSHYKEIVELTMHLFHYKSQVKNAFEKYNIHKELVESSSAQYKRADEIMRNAKIVANDCLKEVQAIVQNLSPEEQEEASRNSDNNQTAEEIHAQLQAARQRLSLFSKHGVSGNVVNDYNDNKLSIKSKREKLEMLGDNISRIQKRKTEIRDSWEPRLKKLVDSIDVEFGKAMRGLNCVGEVRLVTAPSTSTKTIINTGTPQEAKTNGNDRFSSSQKSRDNFTSSSQKNMRNGINDNTESTNRGTFHENSSNAVNDEGFNNWGIEIWVSFRADEPTVLLTEQRQSGGERAVSTALYLQAIQAAGSKEIQNEYKNNQKNSQTIHKLGLGNKIKSDTNDEENDEVMEGNQSDDELDYAGVPFRVVDEVNQGMDQRNERLIHSQIVKTACQESSPQYFLITPKLLPNLEYHKNMKVHCIFNGEWQPATFSVAKYIDNKLS
ncbi:hypothetical protein BB559_002126 [Furculomyces boomerangus]|uniref:Structural maintenance of chromosomes protein 5 n=1 Tax=Furculomyces boomerangus TaxID=61424 RepID=A0A2T9YXW4_9FUNG|nr:hypothetical protein BB559_002126 [Furculomyces boomerangus]